MSTLSWYLIDFSYVLLILFFTLITHSHQ